MTEALAQMLGAGMTHSAVAAHFNVSPKTIQRALKDPAVRQALAAQRRRNADRILRKVDAVLAARVDAHAEEMSTAELLKIRRAFTDRVDVAPAAPAAPAASAAELELEIWLAGSDDLLELDVGDAIEVG